MFKGYLRIYRDSKTYKQFRTNDMKDRFVSYHSQTLEIYQMLFYIGLAFAIEELDNNDLLSICFFSFVNSFSLACYSLPD